MDNGAYIQAAGLKWMFEMELFLDAERSKSMINVMKLNVLSQSKRFREVEFLISRENRQMLVLLELSWLGRKFFRKRIFTDVYECLNQLLPTFKFRVIDDPAIMAKSVALLERAIGGQNEVRNGDPKSTDKHPGSDTNNTGAPNSASDDGAKASVPSGSEEQQQPESSVRSQPGSGDSDGQS